MFVIFKDQHCSTNGLSVIQSEQKVSMNNIKVGNSFQLKQE